MMNLGLSEEMVEIREKIRDFVENKVDPVEAEYYAEVGVGDRWSHTPRQDEILNSLKADAIHPNARGYRQLSDGITQALKKAGILAP